MVDTGAWDGSSLDLITRQVVEHTWRVEFPTLDPSLGASVPAWDVEVSLDGSRSPYGTLKFKAPAAYIAETPDGAGTVFGKLIPYGLPLVRVWAGWRHAIGGAMVDDSHILFAGFVTARRLRVAEGRSYVEFEASTAEVCYSYPSHRTTTGAGGTRTTIVEQMDNWSVAADKWYRTPLVTSEAGYMNTPTAAQASEFQTGNEMDVNDDVMEYLTKSAAVLGQWIRGDVRAAGTPGLLVSADPYPYRTSYTFAAGVFTEVERVDDLDQWANVLSLTAEWGTSSKAVKAYKTADVAPGGTSAVRGRAVTVAGKPPGGVMPAAWPLALAWLRRISAMCEVFYTAQGRAVWWLQPRIHGVKVDGLGLADAAGPLNSVTFNVDTGTMTLTWATDNTRT